MTVEYICNKCDNKKNVRNTVIKALPYNNDEYTDFLFEEDLCDKCRKKLKAIADKFINNDEIMFAK